MKRRGFLGDLALDGRILLKRFLNKWVGYVERIYLAITAYCEYGTEPSDSKKGEEFLDMLGDH